MISREPRSHWALWLQVACRPRPLDLTWGRKRDRWVPVLPLWVEELEVRRSPTTSEQEDLRRRGSHLHQHRSEGGLPFFGKLTWFSA